MKKHVKSCPERLVPCPNRCGTKMLPKKVDAHVHKKCRLSAHPPFTAPCHQYTPFKVCLNEQTFLKESPSSQMKGYSNNPVPGSPLDKPKKGPSSHGVRIQQKESKTHIPNDCPQPVLSECISTARTFKLLKKSCKTMRSFAVQNPCHQMSLSPWIKQS